MTRYDLVTYYRAGSSIEEMERSDDGEWVRYEEVEALKAEIKRLVLSTPNIEGPRGNDELRRRVVLLVEAAPGAPLGGTMTVYVLQNGCYSDEHIVGIYSSRSDAKLAAEIFSDDAHIEEWEVDTEVRAMRNGARPYFIRLDWLTGDVKEIERSSRRYGAYDEQVHVDTHRNLYTHCWAMSDEAAIKIAADRRRMFLANMQAQGDPAPHRQKGNK